MAFALKHFPNGRLGFIAVATTFTAMLMGSIPTAAQPLPESVETAELSGSVSDDIRRFCTNIADAARDRRYALQKAELETLREEIDERIVALEAKRAEYEGWLTRRTDFLAKVQDDLVEIYASMRPDAAAERLAAVQVELAAGILMKIDARDAGVILNEMETQAAATLTGVMASAARKQDPS